MSSLTFSHAAQINIAETDADWQRDLADLISGKTTPAALLAHCLDGADDDRVGGWEEYVATLEANAAATPADGIDAIEDRAHAKAMAAAARHRRFDTGVEGVCRYCRLGNAVCVCP